MTTASQPRARKPWEDELARLRWLESRFAGLAADLEHSARELREKIVPASDIAGLDLLDARAAELAGAAETITGLLAASHAGPPAASGQDWVQWHLDELSRLLHSARDRGCHCTLAGNIMDGAGNPE